MDDHISESELAVFAFDPEAVSEERRSAIIRHTVRCAACRSTRDFFAATEDDLADVNVWEPIMGSDTRDALMAYSARIADEDREAEELLKPFFETPALAAYRNLATQSDLLTAGVVRRLSTRAREVCEDEPLDALTFAEAAAAIAEALPDDAYPAKAVFELRGTAWREQASALMLLGRCPAALDALTRAERAYRNLTSSAFGLSCVALVRAGVLYQQQRLEEAAVVAERAEHGFAHLGDDDRRMKALCLRAGIKFEAQRIDEAAELLRQLVEYGESINDSHWIALGSSRLGNCEVARGNLGEASLHFHKALAILRDSGPENERVSAEWGIACILLQGGRHTEAIARLRDVEAQFEARGMLTDAALAGLDIAEAFLALGKPQQIVQLATRLFRVFADAGMLTGALTALAYIKEAAAAGTLTPFDLQTVRSFLRRAERQPDLLFVPPPSSQNR